MFYSQTDFERGFNINKELVVNMQEVSLISQRQIYDHMKSNSIESHTIKVTKELLASVKGVRTRYEITLEEKKERENRICKGHETKANHW